MHEQVESIIKYSTQRSHYLVSDVSTQRAVRERRISIEKASAPDFHRYRSEHRKDGAHARSSPPVYHAATQGSHIEDSANRISQASLESALAVEAIILFGNHRSHLRGNDQEVPRGPEKGMRRTLKYRLYRSKRDTYLIRQIHAGASIWNHSLALQRRYYRMYGKHLGANRLMKHIARVRRNNAFWKRLGSQAVQDVVQRLDKSWKRFFSDPKAGRPRFQKSRLYTSFTLKAAGWKYEGGNRIRIGEHNHKFVLSRPVTGTIKTVTIKRDRVGDLWICFSVIEDKVLPVVPDEDAVTAPIGIDWGLKNTMNFSDGRAPIDSPYFFRQSLSELQALQRRLSKRKHRNGGKRTGHTEADRKRVARVQRRIADQRRDWSFKTAHELCDEFDGIAVEKLSGVWMQRSWGRKASDIAWSEFVNTLEYICLQRGVLLKKVDPKNTSRECSCCGHVNTELAIADRTWTCAACRVEHDRDQNAGQNILKRAFFSQRDSVSGGGILSLRVAAVA